MLKIRLLIMSVCLFLRIWGAENKFIASIATIGIAVMVYMLIASAIKGRKKTTPAFKWGCLVGVGLVSTIAIYYLIRNVWQLENFTHIAAITAISLLVPFVIGLLLSKKGGAASVTGGILASASVSVVTATLIMYFLSASDTTQHIAEAVLQFK